MLLCYENDKNERASASQTFSSNRVNLKTYLHPVFQAESPSLFFTG